MIIKKLELQGFKSFPERTKIVFHPGITAIVGPNGTGKSNIVDAIVWVLGGQRQKGLRGEKTEHIIFNGNTKKPPLGMAEVSLFLEDDKEEIVISHRVFRSGESEYRLNGKAARLKEIQDALWKRAVAEKDYFVIEQGSIGLLLTTKPTEKRLFLEEAAGTAFYKDKKKEAQSKLASTEQNLIRLEDIISEVARAKNSLQRQAQAAARYRKLREKIRELTAVNFRRKLEELKKKHDEVARCHSDGLLEEKTLAFRIKSEERDLAEKRRQAWELEKNLKENQAFLHSLESQAQRTEAEREREARQSEHLAEKIKKATAATVELEEEMSRLNAEIAQGQSELAGLEKMRMEKIDQIDQVESVFLSSQGDFALFEKTVEARQEAHLKKLSILTELKNEALKTEKELDLLHRQEVKLITRLAEEGTLLRSKEKDIRELEKNLAEDQKTLAEQEKKLADCHGELEAKRETASKLHQHIDDLEQMNEEDLAKLEALRRIETSSLASEKPTELPEALGRLADLLEADDETAALLEDFWKEEVCSSVVFALDFLKRAAEKELQGRFLLVRPSPPQTPTPLPEHPDVLGTLKSRLRPHPKIQDYLGQLEEAVIVRDLPTAIELWLRFPNLNFLTPSGDVLLSHGLLKMGKKEAGLFTLGKEIKSLEEKFRGREAEISPLRLKLEATLSEVGHLEEKLRAEMDFRDELLRNLQAHERAKIALTTELEKISTLRTLLDHELEALRQDRKELTRKRQFQLEKINQLEAEADALKTQKETAEKELSLRRGGGVEGEKRLIELRAAAELIQEKIRHVSLKLGDLNERKESLRQKIAIYRQEIELGTQEAAASEETQRLLESRAKKIADEKTARQAELEEKKATLERLRAETDEAETKLAELREELEKKKDERVRFEVAKAEIDRDLVNLEEACWQELKKNLDEIQKEPFPADLLEANVEEQLARAEEELQKFKAVNLMAEEEFLRHKERYDFLSQQRNDLRESITATLEAIRQIDEESKNQFLAALAEVKAHFQEVFALLFKGGSASVQLLDESNPLESGIEIIAQPPGKKVQNINLLSGGEKSLAGLAFLFALFRYKPTPFCILDEVDAALDDANLARFLELMRNLKKNTQFIIITHNYKTMEVADYIYGTTMAEPNITGLYSVKLEKQQELIP